MVRQKDGAYDRVQPYRRPTASSRGHSSSKERRPSNASDQGISGMESVSGGCDTMMVESKTPVKKKGGVEAAVSNRSKINVLVTILAVTYAQFILCVVAVIVIILHHNRSVDWFPALIGITGEGYKKTIPKDD
ncbi:hypothetical protein ANCCAN_02723 [Ancylostoma caninum]|uniref:Uncharacterized protein n=1 Tax=Ancylostoma caninum TaxID=29170 RepID=A0A368H789_ANCCA|nr:hypothetical protein ANCCAN_02723 [Ancylostoma caninum]